MLLLVFSLDDKRYALHLTTVQTVVRAVESTPLPKAPDIVTGIVNMHGNVIPLVNVRKRFRLPERDIGLSDHLIVAQTARRAVALIADNVEGVIEHPDEWITAPETIMPQMEYIEGVAKLADGMVLIHDLDRFLSLDEEKALNDALKEQGK
ncbi:MAG: chemotaxis protein CheW [Nitrospirota bacterium]